MSSKSITFGWPVPEEGPQTPNKYEASSNPVLRGYTLAAVVTIIKSSSWIQNVLWKMNKFDQLKMVPDLTLHEPRYDPTVIPAATSQGSADKPLDRDELAGRRLQDDYYTTGDYVAAYKSGRLTPTVVVRSILSRIQDSTKKPNRFATAYLEVHENLVLAAAEASTERWKQGNPLSIVDGVPIAVKDEVDLAGYSRSLGSTLNRTNKLDTTAWCVSKWEEAGAVIIGKTNMYEFGLDTSGNNIWHGTPLMPHNEGYYPGGSSSGSAVTVAQGICPIALGADGGGSIRVPSSFCGIYGLKPSHGRVSSRPTQDLAYSVGVYGPMSSDLDSLEVAYQIMAQPDSDNLKSRSFPSPSLASPIPASSKPRTIGICQDWIARADSEVLKMFNDSVQHYCKEHGYVTVDIRIPLLPEGQKSHALTILSEIRAGMSNHELSKLSYSNQLLLAVAGSQATAQDLLAAQRIRNIMMKHLAWLWEQYPDMLIVTPTTPNAGWKIQHPSDITSGLGVSDGDQSLRTMEYVFLANWTGCPAISRPMGYAKGNIPVGLMAMGPWGSEQELINWARDGEGLLEGGSIRRPSEPGIWVDNLQQS